MNNEKRLLLFNVGYLMARFEYFQGRFAQEADQSGPRVDQDRTRRALSDARITFSKRPFHLWEKPEFLPKTPFKLGKTCHDSRRKGIKLDQWWIKIELDVLYPMHESLFPKDPSILEKNPKYRQKPCKLPKNLSGFVQKADQTRTRMDQDRTRCALSDARITFSKRPFHPWEKPEIPPKTL